MDRNIDGKRDHSHAFPGDQDSPRPRKREDPTSKTPRKKRVRAVGGASRASAVTIQPPSASKVTTPRVKGTRVNFVDASILTREAVGGGAPSGSRPSGSRSTTINAPTTPTATLSPNVLFFGHHVQFRNTGISPLLGRYGDQDALPMPPQMGRKGPPSSPVRGTSSTPMTLQQWADYGDPDAYVAPTLPETLASQAMQRGAATFEKGAKGLLKMVKDVTRRYAILGWMLERREETLLEVMRLDATPAADQACTMCRLSGEKGGVNDIGAGAGGREESEDYIGDSDVQGVTAGGSGEAEGEEDDDGWGNARDTLATASTERAGRIGRAKFRCEDCRFAALCSKCVVREHILSPFHRIERVNGHFWERIQHKEDIGITVQLIHEAGDACFRPSPVKNFSVMHTNGIHRMTVNFCRCNLGAHLDEYTQLLRARLWPATIDDPQTATTFEAMDDFNRLSMLGRLTAYDYYKAMRACTDAVGLLKIASLLKQFTRGAHEFRHIFLFKRAGRAYEGGIYSSPPGSCAIECPGCAREGVNVPEGYQSEPDAWKHDRPICVDANFRLANKLNRSSDKSDPSLTDGKAYVVASDEFKRYCDAMEKNTTKEKPSDCSRFGAMEFANQRGGRYMRSTGVAGVFCARHDMILPLAMGQLKVGERYSVIDFCVANANRFINVEKVTISYDIACQWSRNFIARMESVDPEFANMYEGARSVLGKTLEYVVPKFHLFAHKVKCWFSRFNLAYLRFAGQTDGEGCERFWSGANGAANSVREMGPGSVRDMFDSMWDAWNFNKCCEMGSLILAKETNALKQAKTQAADYNEMRGVMRDENPELVDEWERRPSEWEANGRQEGECPYEIELPDVSLKELRRQVEQEDAREVPVPSVNVNSTIVGDRGVYRKGGGEKEHEKDESDSDSDESDGEDEERVDDAGERSATNEGRAMKDQERGDVDGNEQLAGTMATKAGGVNVAGKAAAASTGKEDAGKGAVVATTTFDDVSAGELMRWLILGLSIEETRQRVAAGLPDDDGEVDVGERASEVLLEKLQQFRKDQERFMPETYHNLTEEERTPDVNHVHRVSLHLPSYLGKDDAPASKAVADMEGRLRLANMHGALEELKRFIHLRVQFNKYKIRHITGQHLNTMARSAQATTEKRITAAAGKYRRHRAAYKTLVGPAKKGWEVRWKKLKPKHCVGLGDTAIKALEAMEAGHAKKILREHAQGRRRKLGEVKGPKPSTGTTKAKVSWIWYNVNDAGEGLEMTDDLMVELLKARARAQRWIEQVIRLRAEFDRLIETDYHDARVWEERAKKWEECPPEGFDMRRPAGESVKKNAPQDKLDKYDGDTVLMAGLQAYAYKQAHYRRQRAKANERLRDVNRTAGDRLLAKYSVDGLLRVSA